jgi:hypothetical protein
MNPPSAQSLFSPKFIISLGVPAALCVFLVYSLVQMLPALLTKITEVEAKVDTYTATDIQEHEKVTAGMSENTRLLRGICINTADGDPKLLSNCNL